MGLIYYAAHKIIERTRSFTYMALVNQKFNVEESLSCPTPTVKSGNGSDNAQSSKNVHQPL